MKWAILLTLCLQGCAAYTVASTATLATTGKSIADHTLTAVIPNSDCGVMNVTKSLYYCEINDPTTHYNRNGY